MVKAIHLCCTAFKTLGISITPLSLREGLMLCLRRTLQVLKCLSRVACALGPFWGLEKFYILTKEAVALCGVTKTPAILLNTFVYFQCQMYSFLRAFIRSLVPFKNSVGRSLGLTDLINRDGNLSGSVCPFLLEWLTVLTHRVLFPNTRNVCSSNILECSNGGFACGWCRSAANRTVTSQSSYLNNL